MVFPILAARLEQPAHVVDADGVPFGGQCAREQDHGVDERHHAEDHDAARPDHAQRLPDTGGFLVEQVAQGAAHTDDGVEGLRLKRTQVREVQTAIVVHEVQNAEIGHVVPVQRELDRGDVRDHQPPRHVYQFLGVDAGASADLQDVHVGLDVAAQHVHVDEEVELAPAAARQPGPFVVGQTIIVVAGDRRVVVHCRSPRTYSGSGGSIVSYSSPCIVRLPLLPSVSSP